MPLTIDRLLSAIKQPFSVRVKNLLEDSRSRLLDRLTVRERPGKTAFRFRQEGPGYDRNLSTEKATLDAIDSIHRNPVRRKLCTKAVDWKWSSARWYESDRAVADIDLPTIHGLPPHLFTS